MRQEELLEIALEQERTLYRVARTLLRSDADCADAVQEALLKGLRGAERLRCQEYFQTWMTRILINTCKDLLRRRKRTTTVALPESYPAPDGEEQRELYDALSAMDEKLRLPLVLHYLEDFSVREIAQMLKTPEGTVKRRLWLARNALRQSLTEEAI